MHKPSCLARACEPLLDRGRAVAGSRKKKSPSLPTGSLFSVEDVAQRNIALMLPQVWRTLEICGDTDTTLS
jgi:hypothetical protein